MKKNSIGGDYTSFADGWSFVGGVIKRLLRVTGSDVTITGSGTETYVYPIAGDVLLGRDSVDIVTNKRITARVTTEVSSATPTINTDNSDAHTITILATDITSMTTNLSGSPTDFQKLTVRIKDDGTIRAITWGASFDNGISLLPTTTIATATLTVDLMYNSILGKWECISTDVDNSGRIDNVTTVNAAAYTVKENDYDLSVTYTPTGAVVITIPTALDTKGRTFFITDDGDNALTNNITIEDDAGTPNLLFTIDTNSDTYMIRYNGTEWRLR